MPRCKRESALTCVLHAELSRWMSESVLYATRLLMRRLIVFSGSYRLIDGDLHEAFACGEGVNGIISFRSRSSKVLCWNCSSTTHSVQEVAFCLSRD